MVCAPLPVSVSVYVYISDTVPVREYISIPTHIRMCMEELKGEHKCVPVLLGIRVHVNIIRIFCDSSRAL